jgi:hypothetical protein
LLGGGSIVLFLLTLVIGSIVSYSVTALVFLPFLFVLSRVRTMTGVTTSLLGLALGMAAYVPWTWIEWKSSGVDSGPPTESYLSFALRWDLDPLTLVFLPAGLVTHVSQHRSEVRFSPWQRLHARHKVADLDGPTPRSSLAQKCSDVLAI